VGHWWDIAVPEVGATYKLKKAYARYLEGAAKQRLVN
jgi:3D-(3,5/4)-trihydroxycyclohexane-1,2-dione acylhydrolase (decyclizing)